MDRHKLRTLRTVAAGSFITLLIAACGGSSGASGNKSPVVMAVTAPLTGAYAVDGTPILEGSKTAQYVINQAGGILGRHLQLDETDTVGDPGDAVPAVNKELATGNPVALIGPVTLSIHAIEPIFDRAQIVDGWNGGSSQFDKQTDKWLYRCNASDSELGVAMAEYAIEKGYKTAAMFMSNSVTVQTLEPVIASAYKALGGTMVGTIGITPVQTNYLTEVQRAVALKPDVFFTQMEPGTASVAFKDFQQVNGLAIPFIGTDLESGSDFIKAVGPAAAAAHMTAIAGSNALTPGAGAAYGAAYQKVNGHLPQGGSGYAFDCAIVFALAMDYAKSTDPKVWVNDIEKVSNPPGTKVGLYKDAMADIKAGKKINYDGASGPMDFNQYHNVTGAWDVIVATGTADASTKTIETIPASTIQKVVNKEG